MLKRPRTDFWQVGIVPVPIAQVDPERLAQSRARITWMPDAGRWRYFADPFALRRGDTLHVFVEAFDYRTKHGVIERHELDLPSGRWSPGRIVLARPFHLSYPFVFEHEGSTWMVPESHQAGEVALYKGSPSLDEWTRVQALVPDVRAVDASLLQHGGRWWMFYSVVGDRFLDRRELHVAHAPALQGPWERVPGGPVLVDAGRARPGGTPFVDGQGRILLPLQDSAQTYGGALRLLQVSELTPERVRVASEVARLTGAMASDDHVEGLHTLSACGDLTLIDVKRIDDSRERLWLDVRRRLRRIGRRFSRAPA